MRSAAPPSLRAPGAVLLVSCYELGHQPLGLASPLAALEAAGFAPAALDVSVAPLDEAAVGRARLVAISVPMHTALRLGIEVARAVRTARPNAFVVLYGHYAELNAEWLLGEGIADATLAGETEGALVALVEAVGAGEPVEARGAPVLAKVPLATPSRAALPPLSKYARLVRGGATELAGYVEASRGCLHRCRHCPIPPVYDGRFFVVPRDVVLADVRQQVAAGARHITFGDPDFLNGPGHGLPIMEQLHRELPEITFDVTAKVEHLLRHAEALPRLAASGCLFVVSAVEALSDHVLQILDKGHDRADVVRALRLTREAGLVLRPTFVPFTPWTSLEDYVALIDFVEEEGIVGHVDPVQLAIRLLVPPGSLLAEHEAFLPHRGALDRAGLVWRWAHPDPRMDELQRRLLGVVDAGADDAAPGEMFAAVAAAARDAAGLASVAVSVSGGSVVEAPRLSEAWFC